MITNNHVSYENLMNLSMIDNDRISITDLDWHTDSKALEAYESLNDLNFISSFAKINDFNQNKKIKMMMKLYKSYGKYNKSLEEYCISKSMEADEASTGTNTNTSNNEQQSDNGDQQQNSSDNKDNQNKSNDPKFKEKLAKIGEFISKTVSVVVNAIKKFFSLIKDKIIQFITWVNKKTLHKDMDASNIPVKPDNAYTFNKINFENSKKLVNLFKENCTTLVNIGNSLDKADPAQSGTESDKSITNITNWLKTIPGITIDTAALGTPDAWKKISQFKLDFEKSETKPEIIKFFTGCEQVKGDKITVGQCFGTGNTEEVQKITETISNEFNGCLKEMTGPYNEAVKFCDKIQKEWKNAPSDSENAEKITKQRQTVLMCLKMVCRLQEVFSKVCITFINITHNASIQVTTVNKVDDKKKEKEEINKKEKK